MKRGRHAIILFILLLIFLLACQMEDKADTRQQEENNPQGRLIGAVTSDSINTTGMTKLREFSFDLDLDNTEERLELYTAAGLGEDGEMAWDDGQSWILAVRDGEKSYPLLSEFVQLGVVYFTVSTGSEGQMPNITVIVNAGASFSMRGYAFSKEKNGFTEELLYVSKDDCWYYSSIPSY